jgi:hypothetical protein
MARSPGCSLVAVLVVASWIAACGPRPAAGPADPAAAGGGPDRGELEMELRQRLARVEGDACAKQAWLKELVPKARGLQAEVAEELLVEQAAGCRRLKAAPDAAAPDAAAPDAAVAASEDKAAPAPAPGDAQRPAAPEPVQGACTRRRAEHELRAQSRGRPPTRGQIDAEFVRCFHARLAACQLALDADIDEGLACWRQDPWPEVPASVEPGDVAQTATCLVELKGVIADLRRCRTKQPADRDPCIAPYIGYTPQCTLLKADRVWRMFPGREDVERLAQADADRRDPKAARERAEREAREAREAKLKAEEEKRLAEQARLAKEAERCFGRTTLEFAEKLKAQPGPRSVPGCKYQVVGRVFSRNNVFVQLVDPSGALVVLLRTKEPFAEGEAVADRTATFDSVEEAETTDGSKRAWPVFVLEPAARPKP